MGLGLGLGLGLASSDHAPPPSRAPGSSRSARRLYHASPRPATSRGAARGVAEGGAVAAEGGAVAVGRGAAGGGCPLGLG